MSKELADVLGIIFVIAKILKIDVEEALVKKWITKEWLKKKTTQLTIFLFSLKKEPLL